MLDRYILSWSHVDMPIGKSSLKPSRTRNQWPTLREILWKVNKPHVNEHWENGNRHLMLANAARAGEIHNSLGYDWLCKYGSLSKNSNCGISWAKLGDGHVAQAQATPVPYCKWEIWWLCTPRSMQRRFIITSIQIYGTVSRLLRLTAWISQMGMIMVVYCKIYAVLVHYHKHTNLRYGITTS